MSEQIYLSRRNLLMLLAKLDRNLKNSGESTCTIIKYRNVGDQFVQTMDAIAVTAIENEDYYTKRSAGPMHPADEVAVATKMYGDAMGIKSDVCTRDAPTSEVQEGLISDDTCAKFLH